MRHKYVWLLSFIFILSAGWLLHAEDPTSKFMPLAPLASSLSASSTSNPVQFEVWDQAAAGTMIFAEAHTVDTDAGSSITNDTGFAGLLLGRGVVGGLVPANFPAGSSRYLDVTQSGISVLAARVPLYASAFTISAPNEIPGNLTLVNSTDTSGNILKDGALFLHNFGTNNTFLGVNAGNVTMTGVRNTASGDSALSSNTTGALNTATGFRALRLNTTGVGNTANGAGALAGNTTGANNTAVGTEALVANINGDNNTAVGTSALSSNTSGFSNTANGVSALQSNNMGHDNTATGVNALAGNTSGFSNTASGVSALLNNTTGDSNTASGHNALNSNTTGIGNTAIGSHALYKNTTAQGNTAIGFEALKSNTGIENTAIGFDALLLNTSGSTNTALGTKALRNNATGQANIAIGSYADVSAGNLNNAIAIGSGAIVNASNKIRLGDTTVTVIEGQVAYTFTSDKNQKENFQRVKGEQVLRKIRGLSLTSWNYIGHDPKQFRHYGPVAQEFFGAFGRDAIGTIGNSTTINSGDMEGILMVAVQALEKRTRQENIRLEKAVEVLNAENAGLKARLEAIERRLGGNAIK